MPGLHGRCSEVYTGSDGRRVIIVGCFENFSQEELLSLMNALNESSFWNPIKSGLLKEIRETYMKKFIELHSGIGGGA